jgi:phospholipid/cholesterol/gamma-HCH transport system permease protein
MSSRIESTSAAKAEMSFSYPTGDTLRIHLQGDWKLGNHLPGGDPVIQQIESKARVTGIQFDTQKLKGWDSGLLTFLIKILDYGVQKNITVNRDGLPDGVNRLLNLASGLLEKKGTYRPTVRISLLSKIGDSAIGFSRGILDYLGFIGEASIAFVRLLRGKARFRRIDFYLTLQEAGAQALPIVSLISLLVGLILAFVGAIQLKMFGAQIYIADLVGIGMVREMGAIMMGIIMAGRTGAAFAAQLGSMQVNEEIDALKTMGISPMEFLVLPRMLALFLMMPLLTLYADLMGVLGGLVVGVFVLDLNVMEYYQQTRAAIGLNDLWVGIFMGAVFGVLVAMSGCLRGIRCGRSASAVGEATTSAVVTGIVSIIVATAIITVLCDVLGI